MGSSPGVASCELRRRRLTAAAVVGAALAMSVLAAAGCGRKADPLPPQIRRAETTRDLRVYQENMEAVLTWSYPSVTTAGGPLPDVEAVEVWRLSLPTAGEPPPATTPGRDLRYQVLESQGTIIATLGPEELAAATRGPQLVYRDDLAAWYKESGRDLSQVLWYAVRTICCHHRVSAFSNIARLVPELPPSPPTDLAAAPGADGILISWQAPEGVAVEVERSSPNGSWTVITAEPVTGHEWLDRSAAQGATWSYRLRSVKVLEDGARVVGPPSAPVTVSYPDVYPPPPPANLVCLPEAGLVRLRWEAAPGASFYVVSRRTARGGWQTLADHLEGVEFADRQPPAGELTYAVRSADQAGNQSEPATCSTAGGAQP